MVWGVRATLDLHPSFVCVRLDLRNAYNAIWRSVVLRRMAERSEFAHLVPFMHALSGVASDLLVGRMRQRLFDDGARSRSVAWRGVRVETSARAGLCM